MALVFITGASSGIGKEFAYIAAKSGCDIIISARSSSALESIKADIQSKYTATVHILVADLSEQNGAEFVVDLLNKNNLFPNYLINNAGFGDLEEFAKADIDKLVEMINLNILSLMKLTRLLLPNMIENGGGKILNVASVAGFMPGPMMAVYYATKAFVLSFSEAISEELKNSNITVTTLCPGPTISGFQSRSGMGKVSILSLFKLPTSQIVAQYGWDSMTQGKVIAVHGGMYKFLVQFIRFMPRSLVRIIVLSMQKQR